jgi:hypothetical protein
MKRPLRLGLPRDGEDRKSWVISIVLHTLLVIGASSIAIVPILNLVRDARDIQPEHVTYIEQNSAAPPKVARDSQPGQKAGKQTESPVRREPPPAEPPATIAAPPVAVVPPAQIPVTIPPPRTAAGGDTTDRRIVGRNMLPRLSPGPKDLRLLGKGDGKSPDGPLAPPRNLADSAVHAWVRQYWDSVAHAQNLVMKKPPSWTIGEDGDKWGIDPAFIHFGKFKVPTALLALIPIPVQGNPTAFERNRALASMQREIEFQALRSENSKDFMESVKELRARKEAEHQARNAARKKKQ